MDPTNSDTRSTDEALSLGGHSLESRRNPGRYIQDPTPLILVTLRYPPDPKDHYRSRYGEILRHGKIDLRQNTEQAYEMNFGQWVEMSRDKGPWDYESSPFMQTGVRQGLYTQALLVRFRRFHIGRSGAALGLILETAKEWIAHLDFSWDDEALQLDVRDGWWSYLRGNVDQPRNDAFFQRMRQRAEAFAKSEDAKSGQRG